MITNNTTILEMLRYMNWNQREQKVSISYAQAAHIEVKVSSLETVASQILENDGAAFSPRAFVPEEKEEKQLSCWDRCLARMRR